MNLRPVCAAATTRIGLAILLLVVLSSATVTRAADQIQRPFVNTWRNLRPTEQPLDAVVFADARTGVAVGPYGTIVRTQNGGSTWQEVRDGDGSQASLSAVAFADARTGVAVGYGGTIMRTQDGGATWQETRRGRDVYGVQESLYGVHFADAQIGVAVGDGGMILRTQDGGETWQEARGGSGTQQNLRAVVFADTRTGVAVGDDGTIVRTQDAGETWEIPRGGSGTHGSLRAVAFADVRTGVAVGDDGTIVRTQDAGETWREAPLDGGSRTQGKLVGVHFADARIGVAVGDDGTIVRTQDGGKTWEVPHGGSATRQNLFGVHFADARTGAAVGDDGTIIRTQDGGETWQDARGGSGMQQPLRAVVFADARIGVAVGFFGTIVRTQDGGETWQAPRGGSATRENLFGVHFADARIGVAVGNRGTIVRTQDGGETWEVPHGGSATQGNLRAVHLANARTGVAVGDDGTIVRTQDGGETWKVPRDDSATQGSRLRAVTFADARTGVAVGDDGTIVRTQDAGETWRRPTGDIGTQQNLIGVRFADARTGAAVGDDGTIVRTQDGGETWQVSQGDIGMPGHFSDVYFADAWTGVAVGGNGTIVRTQDGGETWQEARGGSGTQQALFGVHFADARTGIAVGNDGTIVLAGPPIYAPMLSRYKITETGLNGMQVDTWPDEALTQDQSFKLQLQSGQFDWSPPIAMTRPTSNGMPWTTTVNPAKFSIAPGSVIALRVSIDGVEPPLLPFDIGRRTWRPWSARLWEDQRASILTAAAVLAVLLLYLGIFLSLLVIAPRRLAGLGGTGSLDQLTLPGGAVGFVVGMVRSAVGSLAMPWFIRHGRVRRAWLQAYRTSATRLDELGKIARPDFIMSPDLLDAWVEMNLDQAQRALATVDLLRSRRIFVALPVRIDDREGGRVIEKPEPSSFRDRFERRRNVIAIIGEGGAGKSTLACAIARWVMSNDPDERPCPHRMLPVFVLQDTENLLKAIEEALRGMLPGADLPADLLTALLSNQRILVVVDALSERSEATQRHVETLYQNDVPINALLVTTRREPSMGAVERTLLFPEPLIGRRLVPFIMDYLDGRKQDAVFDDLQAVELGRRVLTLVSTDARLSTATPLLALLFVESAVSRVHRGLTIDSLPREIPEVFRDYVRRLNPLTGPADQLVPHDLLEAAACATASVCLGASRVPSDFDRRDAAARLAESVPGLPADHLLDRLISNNLLVQRELAGMKLLRFALDPAAEYLAALDAVRRCGKQREAWSAEIRELENIGDYPERCEGYLQALGVSYRAYQIPLQLPELTLPWEAAA